MGKFAGSVLAESAAIDWGLVGSTVVTGLVVVFLILTILIFFLILFGKIFKAINESKDKREREKLAAKTPKSVSAPTLSAALTSPSPEPDSADTDEEEYEEEDDAEIIAVIAAAIAAYGEAEGKQYRIASVKRQKNRRSGWSSAGIADNMRGFYN